MLALVEDTEIYQFRTKPSPILTVHGIGANDRVNSPFVDLGDGVNNLNLTSCYNSELLVLSIQEQVDLLSRSIVEQYEQNGGIPITLACHSLGCFIAAYLHPDILQMVESLYLISPIYSEKLRESLIAKNTNVCVDDLPICKEVKDSKYYISPAFINDLKSFSCVDKLEELLNRFEGNITVICGDRDAKFVNLYGLESFINRLNSNRTKPIVISVVRGTHNCLETSAQSSLKDIFGLTQM